jgi:acyl-CoA synthetase (AMP-forming)/AMP-acid ligase II
MFRCVRSERDLRARSLLRRWGLTPAEGYALAAVRDPDRVAIIDDRGPVTFAEVDRRSDALACALHRAGIDHRATVAIMCRNHRWSIQATVACRRLGANMVHLEPEDTASRLADIVARADPHALIYDEEFSELLQPVGRGRRHFIAWCHPDRPARCPLLDELIAREDSVALAPPCEPGTSTLLLAGQARSARPSD